MHKRKIALLRSMGRSAESIAALNALLDFNATDAEAWAELADMYLCEGLYQQAIFALEEVLVLMPNAWNVSRRGLAQGRASADGAPQIHAQLGEVSLMAADHGSEGAPQQHLAEALRRYCRSIELCDDYLRGYYGLKVVRSSVPPQWV